MEKSDLMDRAQQEGISVRTELGGVEDKAQDDKPSESSTEKIETNADSGEKETNQTEQTQSPSRQKERFEDNPGFKSLRAQYQEQRRLNEEMREERKQDRLREQRLMAQLDELTKANAPKGNVLPPDQLQARDQLAELLKDAPALKPLFEKLAQVEQFNTHLTSREAEQGYNKVEESMVKTCENYGLDPALEMQACHDWLDQHPVFSKHQGPFPPEYYEVAFKAMNYDRADELAERRANLKSIQERERHRQANSEAPAASLPGGRPLPKKLEDFLSERAKDGIIPR